VNRVLRSSPLPEVTTGVEAVAWYLHARETGVVWVCRRALHAAISKWKLAHDCVTGSASEISASWETTASVGQPAVAACLRWATVCDQRRHRKVLRLAQRWPIPRRPHCCERKHTMAFHEAHRHRIGALTGQRPCEV